MCGICSLHVSCLAWDDPALGSAGLCGRVRASLVAQLVKNLSAMQENQAQFLGWEDPLEKD